MVKKVNTVCCFVGGECLENTVFSKGPFTVVVTLPGRPPHTVLDQKSHPCPWPLNALGKLQKSHPCGEGAHKCDNNGKLSFFEKRKNRFCPQNQQTSL